LAVADLVAARLPGPGAVAIGFARHFVGMRAIALDEELPALLAGPALVVEARVDHQAAGAEGEALEIAEPADLELVVSAELVRDLLGVETPAFGEGAERKDRADQRQAVRILAFPDVAGDRLVVGEVGEVVLPVHVGRTEVDPHPPRNRSVLAARAAVGARCAGFLG